MFVAEIEISGCGNPGIQPLRFMTVSRMYIHTLRVEVISLGSRVSGLLFQLRRSVVVGFSKMNVVIMISELGFPARQGTIFLTGILGAFDLFEVGMFLPIGDAIQL